MVGKHIYGDNRLGCWVTPTQNLADKLRHRLPRMKALGITDIFLPREATPADKRIVMDAGYFVALWVPPPHGQGASFYAGDALAALSRLSIAALELNIEGVRDDLLSGYVREVVKTIRASKPKLRLRINVVPFKGSFLPADLFRADPQLYVIVQNYLGNMDERVAEDEIVRELVDYGIPALRVSVMYGAHIAWKVGGVRLPALPKIRYRGSIYTDDLLADAGYIA